MRISTILLTAALTISPTFAAGLGEIEMNQPFPDLLLPDLETGQPSSLAKYRGERIVLHVFASW